MPEIIFVTPRDLLVVLLVQVALIALAVTGTALAMRAPAPKPTADRQPVECAETVPLPRGQSHGPRTGTIHASAPQYQRAVGDDATQVIEQVGGRH